MSKEKAIQAIQERHVNDFTSGAFTRFGSEVYDSGYNAAIEDAARKLDEYEPSTWCAKCEARTHECGCEPDARTRFMQHVSEAVRGLLR